MKLRLRSFIAVDERLLDRLKLYKLASTKRVVILQASVQLSFIELFAFCHLTGCQDLIALFRSKVVSMNPSRLHRTKWPSRLMRWHRLIHLTNSRFSQTKQQLSWLLLYPGPGQLSLTCTAICTSQRWILLVCSAVDTVGGPRSGFLDMQATSIESRFLQWHPRVI